MLAVIVPEYVLGHTAVSDALYHRGVVSGIAQDVTLRQKLGHCVQCGVVGHVT